MGERAALIKEIDSLPSCYYDEIIDYVGYIKETKVKGAQNLAKTKESKYFDAIKLKTRGFNFNRESANER